MEIKNACCVVLLTLDIVMVLFNTTLDIGKYFSHKLLYISVTIVTGPLSPYLLFTHTSE